MLTASFRHLCWKRSSRIFLGQEYPQAASPSRALARDSTEAFSTRRNFYQSVISTPTCPSRRGNWKHTGPFAVPSQALCNPFQIAKMEFKTELKFKNGTLHLTHKHRLSPLLDQEELSPVSAACFHSKNDQVACWEHPKVRREEQLCQSAVFARRTCKGDQEEPYSYRSTATEPHRHGGTTENCASKIHAWEHP